MRLSSDVTATARLFEFAACASRTSSGRDRVCPDCGGPLNLSVERGL